MSEMHELIMDSTNKIFKDICTKELVDESENGVWAGSLWGTLVQSGITSIGVPESLGGAGGDYNDAFHILRLAGKYAVPLPLSETLIGNWLLSDYNVQPQKGPLTIGIDANYKFNLEKVEKGYKVNGLVNNVPWARYSKSILVLGNLNNQSVITVLPLENATIREKNNLAGEPLDTVMFENIRMDGIETFEVDEKDLIEKVFNVGGLSKAVMMSGALDKVLELSVQYAKEREQFGRPLHRLQAIQQHIAVLSGETIAALTITNKAIDSYEKGLTNEIAHAKLKVSESASSATEIAHQIHGAIGATHEHPLHQYTRRLWSWRDEFGNESFWSEKLAEQFMSTNKQTLWEVITDSQIKETIQ